MSVEFVRPYKYSPDGNKVVTVDSGVKQIEDRFQNKALKAGYAVKIDQKPKTKRGRKPAGTS